MKIYLFNPETGAYLGEDFADEAPLTRGEYIIPDNATMIPPPQVESGQIALFKIREQRWEVIKFPGRAASRLRDTLDYEV